MKETVRSLHVLGFNIFLKSDRFSGCEGERQIGMGLKKGKGKPSALIEERGLDESDHWAFLEEIEAPMWADLTMESGLDEEICAAWFRVSHQVHQISSRQLKQSIQSFGKVENGLPDLGCNSPKVPDSVSRSRGKDYKSRKWSGHVHTSTIKHLHVRKLLGGVSMGEVRKRASGKNSSVSTVTLSSSSRRPLKCVFDIQNSFVESTAKTDESSSSSAISKCQNLRPNLSVADLRKTSKAKKGTSRFASKIYREIHISGLSDSKNARCSARKTRKVENFLQDHQFSAGKSSVGSSRSVGSILENGNSTKMQKKKGVKGIKVASVSAAKLPERKTRNTIQRCQSRAGGTKIVCQETKTKAVGPTAPRKPLAQLNGSRQQGNVVTKPRIVAGAVKKHLKSVRDRENTIEEKLQCLKYVKPGEDSKKGK